MATSLGIPWAVSASLGIPCCVKVIYNMFCCIIICYPYIYQNVDRCYQNVDRCYQNVVLISTTFCLLLMHLYYRELITDVIVFARLRRLSTAVGNGQAWLALELNQPGL